MASLEEAEWELIFLNFEPSHPIKSTCHAWRCGYRDIFSTDSMVLLYLKPSKRIRASQLHGAWSPCGPAGSEAYAGLLS
jgi:hypothetical protein